MPTDTQIANALSKFTDCKYAIDNTNPDDPNHGWDCLNFLVSFFRELGAIIPDEFEGWTLENYGGRALKDPTESHKTFERFVQTLGVVVEDRHPKRGDLVLFNVEDTGIYAGVYLGNGNAFIIFDKGGRMIPFNVFKPHVYQIRRLV